VSSWESIHESLEKAKVILENNQYLLSFYDPIIAKCVKAIVVAKDKEVEEPEENEKAEEKMIFLQVTEKFKYSLKTMELPIKVILTLRKLKTVLPSLKPSVDKSFKSGIVYQITCPRCNSRNVGQSVRHLLTRIKERLPWDHIFNHATIIPFLWTMTLKSLTYQIPKGNYSSKKYYL